VAGGKSKLASKLKQAGWGRPPLARLPLTVRYTVRLQQVCKRQLGSVRCKDERLIVMIAE